MKISYCENKEKQLKEACEGFEAVFVQKLWEQMRQTMPKGGYMHSRDEEMYQSMFDVELSKKMASAVAAQKDMWAQTLAQRAIEG